MGIIRLWPPELIVRHRSQQIVLEPAAPALVADHHVELAVRSETKHAAVVVAPQEGWGFS